MQLTKIEKYLTATAIVVLILLAFRLCNNDGFFKGSPVRLPAPLEQQKIKENIAILKQIDTLIVYKSKVVYKYKTVFDTILKQAPDTCTSYLITLDKECSKKDSVNNVLLNDYSKVVSNYKDIIVLKDYKHSQDSLNMIGLNDEIKHQKKRVVKAKVGGGLIGIGGLLVGFGVGKVIP